ncbi:putative quinol monooxygenase [Sphingomonas montana]|uniref:putative quinol monooxygenase n=1 Tax=Sphingomonas montana TaxID=1843236 RepID=UPI00096F57E0|nr:antibiotic biosynthesis monooxygenase [Sphingomonas montana]
MSEPLTVFARIAPKPEYLEAARNAVRGIMQATHAEPGCRIFTLHEDRDGGSCLYLYEVWEDAAALAAHHAQPYTQSVFDSYREWLSEPVDLTLLREIGPEAECSS